MMRRLRLPLVANAALLLGLLGAAPAAAQPDHLHLDLTLVACGTVQATGFHLPESARLDVRVQDAASGRTLKRTTATTDKDGSLVLKTAGLSLQGVHDVRVSLLRPGAAKPFAFSELTISGECPLPFTGPAQAPAMAVLGLCLLVAGAALLRASAYRGRHRAGRTAAP
jgi:hypothetical protein